MTNELPDLQDAVGHWLRYKSLTGFKDILSESLLTVPVIEFLLGHGWKVSTERDYRSIFKPEAAAGYFNYDLYAERDGRKILIEIKYLKPSGKGEIPSAPLNAARILDDIAKLAFPDSQQVHRLLIVGCDPRVKQVSDFHSIMNEDKCITIDYSGSASFLGRKRKLGDTVKNAACALLSGNVSIACKLEILAPASNWDNSVSVYSVLRDLKTCATGDKAQEIENA